MKTTDPGDAARIELLLTELRLPAVKAMWIKLAAEVGHKGPSPPSRQPGIEVALTHLSCQRDVPKSHLL